MNCKHPRTKNNLVKRISRGTSEYYSCRLCRNAYMRVYLKKQRKAARLA